MNTEKLDDLASQAGFDVARLRAPHPGGFPREDMLALESFAELIVKECAKVAVHKPNGLWYTGTDAGLVSAGRMTAAQLIKEHFGVQE